MKYKKLLALALVSTSQIAIAERVENKFNPNETLTATRMNEIRTAVNVNNADIQNIQKNKQDNIGEGCPDKKAIQAIDGHGTVTCVEIPQEVTGDGATTDYYYISGLDLKALETTGQIHIPDPRTRDSSQSSEGEQHNTQTRWNAYDINGQYAFPTQGGAHEVGHTVRLPSGTKMTDMRCYYYDNDSKYDITRFDFELRKRKYNDRNSGDMLAQAAAPQTSGAKSSIKNLDKTFNHTINNADNTYYLLIHFHVDKSYSSTDSNESRVRADASNLRTYGCRIKYTR